MKNFFNYAIRPDLESEVVLSSKNERADALKSMIDEQGSVFCFTGDEQKLEIVTGYKNRTSDDDLDIFIVEMGGAFNAYHVDKLTPIVE